MDRRAVPGIREVDLLSEHRPWRMNTGRRFAGRASGRDLLRRPLQPRPSLALRRRHRGAGLRVALGRAVAALAARTRSIPRRPSSRRSPAATCSPSSPSPPRRASSSMPTRTRRVGDDGRRTRTASSSSRKVTLDPRIAFSGDKLPDAGADRRLHHARPRGMLHRQFGDDARSSWPAFPRIHPRIFADALSASVRHRPRRDARADRRRPRRRPVRRRARRASSSTAPLDLPRRKGELEVERILGRHGGEERRRPASVPFFVGAGAYKHHVPATRRSPDPALRVPDQLHALPAGDRAGHAAISVRVPDPGRERSPAWRSPTPPCMTARPAPARRC